MGKGKKAFIDRKKAVTFHLVHRSQHDPLVADENAPQRVLLEAASRQKSDASKSNEQQIVEPSKRREEQKKYGILYDDDYDYLQHLKKPEQEIVWEYVENPNQARKRLEENRVTTAPKLNLPSSVFASEFEEDVGLLNKAAPQPGPHPEWDPDIVAALDDDYNYDDDKNELEDDFVLQAMGDSDENEDDDDGDNDDDEDMEEGNQKEEYFDSDDLNESDDDDSELMDRLGPLMRERRFENEETKSRFTEYSMSSSVIRRNEQLTLLDDRFERFYASYDDPELGDLGMEDIEGSWHQKHPYVMNCFKEFKKSKNVEPYKKEWDAERIKKYENVVEGDNDPTEELVEIEVDDDNDSKDKKWDCESILSTYSNNRNRPKLIDESTKRNGTVKKEKPKLNKIQINTKTGLPEHVLRGSHDNELTMKMLKKYNEERNGITNEMDEFGKISGSKSLCAKSVLSTLSVLSIRPKDETPEEKHARKRLLKEYRQERRIERKANAEAFKEEKKRQKHVKLNQQQNQLGKKIV